MDPVEVNDTEMDNELQYEADQWSPFNKNGKKVYSLELLMALRRVPKSNELPENIPEAILTNTNKEIPCKKKKKKNKNTDELVCQLIANSNCDAIHGDLSTIPEALSSDAEIDLISFTVDEYLVENQNMQPGNTAKQEMLVPKQEDMVFLKANAAIVQPKTNEICLDYLPDQPEVVQLIYKILEGYLNNSCTVQQCLIDIQTSISLLEISQLVSFGTISVLNKTKTSRLRTGFLFAQLIKMNILSTSNYCVGLEVIFKQAEQLVIDVPKLWNCLAEVISPVICNNAVALKNLHNVIKLLASSKNYVEELLNCLFKLIIQDRSILFLQSIWKNSNLTFSDFMDECEVDHFVKKNNFEFLLKADATTSSLQSLTLCRVSENNNDNLPDGIAPNQDSGAPPKCKSQQSCSSKADHEIKISVFSSVKKDVKLHETENAWKPARFIAGAAMTEEYKKTEVDVLYKTIRGVLNKLTPQKFETLLDQVRSLSIDTMERLQGVIDLVFEKAVDEPNFSVAYALLCRELALMQVVNVPATEGKKKEGQEFVNFKKLLVTRCQLKFEKNSIDETERSHRMKEIEDCPNVEKKKNMQLDLDEYDRRLRKKSVGNIRFIGELFKQQMLTVNIMLRCLNNLLDTKDEESLECLCKLLTTVGKELETKKVDLGGIFSTMKDLADKKDGTISNKVRFIIQDVIDLRSSRWIPRKQDVEPKTLDQIRKEIELCELLTMQGMNSVLTPRSDESAAKKRNTNVSNDDGWSTAPSRGSRTPFSVQSDKLKIKAPMMAEPLGSMQMFGNWGRGSNIKTQPPLTNTANMYAALENIGTESDKRPALGLRMNNKDPSLEWNYNRQPFEGRGSHSESQHRSHDSSTASQRNTTLATVPSAPKPQAPTGAPPVPAPVKLTPDQLERRLKNILEEYLNDCCSVQECEQDIKASIAPSALPQLVSDGYISILERSKTARLRTGYLFAHLIRVGTLTLPDYCAGLETALEETNELIIDIPRVWENAAELISPVLCESSVTLKDLHNSFEPLVRKNHASKLLVCLFKLIIQEKGLNFLQSCWNSSGFTFADYMGESQVDSYIKENSFEFLLEAGDTSPVNQSHSPLSYEEMHEKLISFFQSNTSLDDIINWIVTNVGERVKENPFIRTLATACFNDSIVNLELKADILQGKYNLLHRFVDNKPTYELQCLYALQTFINKLEHPQGLLLAICDKLYEENVFSHESFVAWEASKDPAEQEGKGMILEQLCSFFTRLKETNQDSSSS